MLEEQKPYITRFFLSYSISPCVSILATRQGVGDGGGLGGWMGGGGGGRGEEGVEGRE